MKRVTSLAHRRCLAALVAVCLASLPGPAAGPAEDAVAREVLDALQQARRGAGVALLAHRSDLDAVALRVARDVAARPRNRRLQMSRPLERRLREAGVDDFGRAFLHLQLLSGAADPASRFTAGWRDYESDWERALAPDQVATGLAVAATDDGWLVLAAILIQPHPGPDEPFRTDGPTLRRLERAVLTAVNEVREKRGLKTLASSAELANIARDHSRDMAARGYFEHRSPEGLEVADRLAARGLGFSRLGENLQKNRGMADPARSAVRSWLQSPAHRKTMLTRGYVETGVGVAVDDQGMFHFTQVFRTP